MRARTSSLHFVSCVEVVFMVNGCSARSALIVVMEGGDAETDLLAQRIAADLVERDKPVVDEKSGVLQALGHNRAGELLPAQQEIEPFLPMVRQIERGPQQKNAAQKFESRRRKPRSAARVRGRS